MAQFEIEDLALAALAPLPEPVQQEIHCSCGHSADGLCQGR
jgi:hypothetical protein